MDNPKAELNCAEVLEKIGLSPLQARVYTVLGFSGKEKVLNISKIANIDRSNTHRIILQLQGMGLVSKTLGTPNCYEAVPIKEAVSTLVNRKKSEYEKTQNIAQEIIETYSEFFSAPQKKEYEFKIIKWATQETAKEAMINTFKQLQKSNDYLIHKRTIIEGLNELYEEGLASLKRGIKSRVISEKITSRSVLKELSRHALEPAFQIRYIPKEADPEIIINDRQVAKITLSDSNSGFAEKKILITNNPGCVQIFQKHFDNLWKNAKQYNLDEIK